MRKILFYSFFLVFNFFLPNLQADSQQYSVIENSNQTEILSPCFAGRATTKIRLSNDLEAYLISDPNVDKSSAALIVRAGKWHDSIEHPGIAHFLEHMLFLGSKKYPQESEYMKFIFKHDGMLNAFTYSTFTAYLFSIDNTAFPEALDRLSNFFIEPLFNPSSVARELKAIDQEHAKNIEDDARREYRVFAELINATHPEHAFGSGNAISLASVTPDLVKEWYHKQYSANRMQLIVSSPLPLEQIKELVVNDFQQVPNRELAAEDFNAPMFDEAIKGHTVYIEPVKNVRQLTVSWEIPGQFAEMRDTQPEQILALVLEHQGNKSLFADLKSEQWVDDGIIVEGEIRGHNFLFGIQIKLTDAGVKNVDLVIEKIFQALANIKKKGIPQYIYDESQRIALNDYQYQPREDAFLKIMEAARCIGMGDIKTYPEQCVFIEHWDPVAVQDFVTNLTPDQAIYSLLAPKSLTGMEPDHTEKWMNVQYTVKEIPKEKLAHWAQVGTNPKIDIPEPNLFIPSKMNVLSLDRVNQIDNQLCLCPVTLVDDETGKIYFSQDNYFGIPQVSWIFKIRVPVIQANSANEIVLGDLFVKYALDSLNSDIYPATQAGLNFDMQRTDNGFKILIDGYDDKANSFFLMVMSRLRSLTPNQKDFKRLKESLLRHYQNTQMELPLHQAYVVTKGTLHVDFVTQKNKESAIKKVTFSQFQEFLKTLFNEVYVEGTLYGNMTEEEGQQISKQLFAILNSQIYEKSEHYKNEVMPLKDDRGPFFCDITTKAQGVGVVLAIQADPFSFKNLAANQILMQAMRIPFFDALRTKQQTAYMVKSTCEKFEKTIFNLFYLQSNSHDGRDLLARIELFIETFMQEICSSELTPDQFSKIRDSLLQSLQQPEKSIPQTCFHLNQLAFIYDADFDWVKKRIEGFEQLTYDEFIKIAQEVMGKCNKKRLAVILSGDIPEDNSLKYIEKSNVQQLRKTQSIQNDSTKKH